MKFNFLYYLITLFIFISLSACASGSQTKIDIPVEHVYNGKIKYLELSFAEAHKPTDEIICDQKKMPQKWSEDGKKIGVLIFAGYYDLSRSYECRLNKNEIVAIIKVENFPYAEEQLKVDQKKVILSKEDLLRAEKEQAELSKIYAHSNPSLLFAKPFLLPIDSFRTSIYGNKRIFNQTKTSTHLGNDYRAAIGTNVPSTNDGVVAFVGDLFFSGNTVIIDHGMNLFSMYAHLSKINVKAGEKVVQGQVIALSGKTGRVSGPHLHWGMKLYGEWVDGVSLIDESSSFFQQGHDLKSGISDKKEIQNIKLDDNASGVKNNSLPNDPAFKNLPLSHNDLTHHEGV